MAIKKPLLDWLLGLTVSKKLFVMLVVIYMALNQMTIEDNFVVVVGIYLGMQGIIDAFKEAMKHRNNDFYGDVDSHPHPINGDNLYK